MKFGDRNELGEAMGAQEAVHQLAKVTQHLKRVFRKTDLVARNGSDFWVIVPYAPATEKLYDKVTALLGSEDHEALRVVNPEISIFNLTDHLKALEKLFKELDALSLLEYLKANKKFFAQDTFYLYPQ